MIDYGFNISLERICFSINQRKFFNNLSLQFSDSGITVILGPNGSGKTLLTKILKGLVKPTSGNVILNNQKIKVGYVSQNVVFLRRSVYDNLAYPMKISGFDQEFVDNRINFLLQHFDFFEKKKLSARKLSAGNKQFLSFIRSLCVEPDLLILDEPCANLDNEFVKKIEFFLFQEKRKKKIIMVTHDLFQAKRLADEVIFLQNGRIIEQSLKQDFLTSKNKIIRSFLDGNLL